MADSHLKKWEDYGEGVSRMKVDGGYIYSGVKGMVFVPDVKTVGPSADVRPGGYPPLKAPRC